MMLHMWVRCEKLCEVAPWERKISIAGSLIMLKQNCRYGEMTVTFKY
jgi:hypothetical protein